MAGLVTATVTGTGCGFLDDDLHKTRQEFERSFDTERARSGPRTRKRTVSTVSSRRTISGCGVYTHSGHGYHRRVGRVHLRGLLEVYCASHNGPICRGIGRSGRGGAPEQLDLTRARTLLVAGCDRDEARACAALAMMFRHGIKGPRDLDTAHDLADKSCELGFERACPNDESTQVADVETAQSDPST